MRFRGQPPAEDADALRRLAAGDLSAVGELYDQCGPRLFRQALWLTGAPDAAEDLVQDAFVKLAGLGPDLLKIRDVGLYLARMVHHGAADRRRRAAVRQETDVEAALFAVADDQPGVTVERDELATFVAALPAAQREVLELHLHEGLSFREIGRITNVTTFTAASRYRLALHHLRRRLTRESPRARDARDGGSDRPGTSRHGTKGGDE